MRSGEFRATRRSQPKYLSRARLRFYSLNLPCGNYCAVSSTCHTKKLLLNCNNLSNGHIRKYWKKDSRHVRIAGKHLRFSKDQDPNLGICGGNKCMVTEEPGTSH